MTKFERYDADGKILSGLGTMDASDVGYTPGNLANWDGGVDPGEANGALDQLAERAKDLEGVGSPVCATMWTDEVTVLAGGALTLTLSDLQPYCMWMVNSATHADGDSFSIEFFLEAGSYTLYCLGVTTGSSGKIDWYVDNVLQIVGQDWYAGVTAYNVLKSAAVTVVGTGVHTLKGVVNGKHASSASYYWYLTKLWMK